MDVMWAILLKGIEDGPEKMVAGLEDFMNQMGATPGELQKMMADEDARREAAARTVPPQRVQPRKLARAQRRQR